MSKPVYKIGAKAYKRDWYLKNKEHVLFKLRKNWLKRLYGLSIEDFDKMFQKQKGLCAICKNPQSESIKSLAVDHCHKTGKVRGLLCNGCNLSVGNYENNKE